MLYTIGQLSNEFPEISDELVTRLEEADLKIPAKPPARQGGAGPTGGSAKGSRAGGGAVRQAAAGRPGTSESGGNDSLSMRSNSQNYHPANESSVLSVRSYELEI